MCAPAVAATKWANSTVSTSVSTELGAPARPRGQQPGQPGRQPRRDIPPALRSAISQRRSGQLLGEKRVPPCPRAQLIHHPRRHRAAGGGLRVVAVSARGHGWAVPPGGR
jgi:hypothetical protein